MASAPLSSSTRTCGGAGYFAAPELAQQRFQANVLGQERPALAHIAPRGTAVRARRARLAEQRVLRAAGAPPDDAVLAASHLVERGGPRNVLHRAAIVLELWRELH